MDNATYRIGKYYKSYMIVQMVETGPTILVGDQVNPAINPSSPPADCNLANLYGISLDGDGNISAINLSNNNLTGSIPLEIGDLVYLTSLDLSNNNLIGSIPSSFWESH